MITSCTEPPIKLRPAWKALSEVILNCTSRDSPYIFGIYRHGFWFYNYADPILIEDRSCFRELSLPSRRYIWFPYISFHSICPANVSSTCRLISWLFIFPCLYRVCCNFCWSILVDVCPRFQLCTAQRHIYRCLWWFSLAPPLFCKNRSGCQLCPPQWPPWLYAHMYDDCFP